MELARYRGASYMLSSSQDGYIIKWHMSDDFRTVTTLTKMADQRTCMAFMVAFVPNTGNRYFVGACDEYVRLYDFEHAQVRTPGAQHARLVAPRAPAHLRGAAPTRFATSEGPALADVRRPVQFLLRLCAVCHAALPGAAASQRRLLYHPRRGTPRRGRHRRQRCGPVPATPPRAAAAAALTHGDRARAGIARALQLPSPTRVRCIGCTCRSAKARASPWRRSDGSSTPSTTPTRG